MRARWPAMVAAACALAPLIATAGEPTVVRDGLDPWLAASTVELYAAVARGALADVSPDVERVLGRPPRRAFVDQGRQ